MSSTTSTRASRPNQPQYLRKGPQNFQKFGNFPPKIREMVYIYAMPGGQIILNNRDMGIDRVTEQKFITANLTAHYHNHLPSLLQVNRGARIFTKKFYKFLHEGILRIGVWMCKDDILSFETERTLILFLGGRIDHGRLDRQLPSSLGHTPAIALSFHLHQGLADALNYSIVEVCTSTHKQLVLELRNTEVPPRLSLATSRVIFYARAHYRNEVLAELLEEVQLIDP